jgi:hypothetical protein
LIAWCRSDPSGGAARWTIKRSRRAARSAWTPAAAEPSPEMLLNQYLEILAWAGARGAEKSLQKVARRLEQI